MLKTVRLRINSALLLTSVIMLLLVGMGGFAGAETVAERGVMPFLLWLLGVAFGIATKIIPCIAYPTQNPASTE